MSNPSQSPSAFYEFDLQRGAVATRGGDRVLVLTDHVVRALVSAALDKGDVTALRELGRAFGRDAASQVEGDAEAASPEVTLGAVGDALALHGFGDLTVTRYGDALALRIENAPALDDGRLALSALLGGVFSALVPGEVACVPVGDTFLVLHPSVAETVFADAQRGASIPQILEKLTPEAA